VRVLSIVKEPLDVATILMEFGVERDQLLDVVAAVVAERANAVPNDPVTAEGQFAYIYGTRHTRFVFQKAGYVNGRENGVEFVEHPDTGVKVLYQSVDGACDVTRSPKAISGKGDGSAAIVNRAQSLPLFPEGELAEVLPPSVEEKNSSVWYFCVSVVQGKVAAELSRPARIDGPNFVHFIERIFILKPEEWGDFEVQRNDTDDFDTVDVEPVVSRK